MHDAAAFGMRRIIVSRVYYLVNKSQAVGLTRLYLSLNNHHTTVSSHVASKLNGIYRTLYLEEACGKHVSPIIPHVFKFHASSNKRLSLILKIRDDT